MVIMIVSILKASHVSWSATEIAHSRLRHDVVRKLMHENYGRCGDGRQGPQKQVAARQADWDLGHVPMMLCPVPFSSRDPACRPRAGNADHQGKSPDR